MRETAVLLLALALVGAAPAADDDAPKPPAGWKEYSPKDKSFSVWVPEKGKEKENEATVHITGAFLKVRMTRVEQDGGLSYSAGILILPLKYRKTPAADLMDATRDSEVKESKGKLVDEKDVKQGSLAGKEYSIETGQGVTRLRVFVAEGRVYRAEVAGSKEQTEAEDAKTFLDSYKLPAKATK